MKLRGSLPKWHFPLMVWATTAKKSEVCSNGRSPGTIPANTGSYPVLSLDTRAPSRLLSPEKPSIHSQQHKL